jgi:DNA-directed RNA polymerase specialized sigma24 family protein
MENRLRKEYQVINLIMEYGGAISGFKYAVASYLPEKELRAKYKKELAEYEPYLYLTGEQGEAIMESMRSERKFRDRQRMHGDAFGYEDGKTEAFHKGCEQVRRLDYRELEEDPLMILVSREEYEERQQLLNERLNALEEAMEDLTNSQIRRLRMVYVDKMTEEEICRIEKVTGPAIHQSIAAARKKLRKTIKRSNKAADT